MNHVLPDAFQAAHQRTDGLQIVVAVAKASEEAMAFSAGIQPTASTVTCWPGAAGFGSTKTSAPALVLLEHTVAVGAHQLRSQRKRHCCGADSVAVRLFDGCFLPGFEDEFLADLDRNLGRKVRCDGGVEPME